MGAHKDRLIQAAELLDMSPDDLMTLLDGHGPTRSTDQLLAHARLMVDEYARAAEDGEPTDRAAGFLVNYFAELDSRLSAGGTPPEEWREGPDAPVTDEQPDREPTPAQERAWDAREDEARGHVLG